ncbi:hypothetical protein COOONC_00146, partial [Cooperia oncophora]
LQRNLDCCLITESWSHVIHDAVLSFDSSHEVHKCNRGGERTGGGVLALIRKAISHKLIIKKDFHGFIQTIIIQIRTQASKILLVLTYRSPSCSLLAFSQFIDFLHNSRPNNNRDFNFPLIDWDNMTHRGNTSTQSSTAFLEFAKSFDLRQIVREPTHGLNILDIILVSSPTPVTKHRVLEPFSTADHNSIEFEVSYCAQVSSEKSRWYRNFLKGDYEAVISALCQIDWVAINNTSATIDIFYSKFVSICNQLIEKYIPLTRHARHQEKYPKRVHFLRARIRYLYRRVSSVYDTQYRVCVQRLKRTLARHQIATEKKIAATKNSKRFYSYCKKKLKLMDSIPNLVSQEGVIVEDDATKANLFADYFNRDTGACLPPLTDDCLDWIDISNDLVYNSLRRLPSRVSTSPDNIPYIFLKKAALGLTSPLTVMFNRLLLCGKVPKLWYRPICLTSSISKVMERIICRKLTAYLVSETCCTRVKTDSS